MRAFLETVVAAGAPADEVRTYCSEDFRRFVYTYGLLRDVSGSCLELGANPYLTTVLLRTFTDLRLTLANYFGPEVPRLLVQDVSYSEFRSGRQASVQLESHHFNIEEEPFPFETDAFDAVLFCEIIEHLLVDPQAVLLEIKRVLKPGGVLIITTPNVSRLENVARMAAGLNIYDPYSGYGPYGRHNREYNRHELWLLLRHLGFEIVTAFSADVHINRTTDYHPVGPLEPLVRFRASDLGQYTFIKASNTGLANETRPSFLYRSYPEDLLC